MASESFALNCPICEASFGKLLFVKKERSFYACKRCSLRLQWPLPSQDELAEYYDREFAQGMYRDFTQARSMKIMTAKARLKNVLAWVKPVGRWLDVGCADGVFVSTAAESGIQASGIELSEVAVEQAIQENLNVQRARIEDLPSEPKYDCITAFDVIEHVLDPRHFLQEVSAKLMPNAICVLSLPNVASIFSRVMGRFWWFYIPEEHLHYFSPQTIRTLAEQTGFEVVHCGRATKPLTFEYGLTQFKEFNPLIYFFLSTAMKFMPGSLQKKIIPFYIGEMMVVIRKT